jgi:hypothetical protein
VVVLTLVAYARFLVTGFGGTDSLPLIETSRFSSLQDAALLFTRPVMAGTRFVGGEVVYRPFVSATFGLDYAIWGLQPIGYHLTNLVLHLAATLGMLWLLTLVGLRFWAALAGTAVFALHPLVVATVPVIARRDSIVPALTFIFATCLLLVAQRACGQRRLFAWLGASLLGVLALLSKESAFVAVAILPVFLVGARFAAGASVRHALGAVVCAVPLVIAAAVIFAVRNAVLGGLGGGVGLSPFVDVSWEKYAQILGAYTRYLIWAFAWTSASPTEIWPRVGAEVLFGLLVTLIWLPRRHAMLIVLGTLWVVAFGAFCAVLKISTMVFVAYFALVGLALVFAAGLEGTLLRLRFPPRNMWTDNGARTRGAALVLLTGLAFAAGMWLWTSPLMRDYYQWRVAGDLNQQYTDAAGKCVSQAPQVSLVNITDLPSDFDDGHEDTLLLAVTLLQDYTVQSALQLNFPQRSFDVSAISAQTVRKPDALRISCAANGNRVELITETHQ